MTARSPCEATRRPQHRRSSTASTSSRDGKPMAEAPRDGRRCWPLARRCSVGTARIFIALALLATQTTWAGWRLVDAVDPMDDSRNVIAVSPLVSSKTVANHSPQAALRVGCAFVGMSVEASIYVSYLNLTGSAGEAQGRVRFGDAPPEILDLRYVSGSRIATLLLGDSTWHVVSEILEAERVLVELPQYGSDPIFEFPLNSQAKTTIKETVVECGAVVETGVPPAWIAGTLEVVDSDASGLRLEGMDSVDHVPPVLNVETGWVTRLPWRKGSMWFEITRAYLNGKRVALEGGSIFSGSLKVPPADVQADGCNVITYALERSRLGQYSSMRFQLKFGCAAR